MLVLMGLLPRTSPLWLWGAPVASSVFLAATGGLLIWDLEHPERFYMIFTHGRWQSWLVKGAYILGGFSLVLAAHFLSSALGKTRWHSSLMLPGIPLAVMMAIYTAYLFAQAKARDLWQSPLLPPQFVVHSLLAGASTLSAVTWMIGAEGQAPLLRIVALTSFLHLFLVWGESTLAHVTTHARLAAWEMTRGKFGSFFWASIALVGSGLFAPHLGGAAAVAALVGLLLYEHAHVQAAQSVPLA
jgi:formate-dependent nitrite reductase membrane component NrfD